ncbi:PLP-dependent transferase [Gloeophyllum trabeum ATCC 11539]|uniref:PLP-dependent transferase n=1 Tax=Gloeophyllum trabeum (strain ATCC 11539 / FP-39264 / Madison 617) TaxID=670483 RepID=S7QB96_GLOTA|nr:PLP-dependent transferase [Gloeophyllum trabeum ATCC 11539]EPQ56597.1 PLP-dependent transferase [Gloeophyllum trabeum ATCC 11539]
MVPTHSDGIHAVEPTTDSSNGPRELKYLPAEFYASRLSDAAKDLQPSAILSLFPLETTPGLISLLAGKPNGSTFPFTSFQYSVRSPVDPSQEQTIRLDGAQLSESLQYGRSAGQADLLEWAYGLQEYAHGRRRGEGWRISVGNGSQDMINKAVWATVNRGDAVLLETPMYSGVLPMFQALHCEMIDDPYYFLYYGAATRPPSYFSLERDEAEVGRVLRFDSLSKILSSGLRVGFISAPEPFVTVIDSHTATSNLHPSSLTQMVAYTLLSSWGYDTLMLHSAHVSGFYKAKRDVFERAMRKHLDGLAEWTPPEAGMFYWFKLLLHAPGVPETSLEEDSEAVIRTKAVEKGVLALPGTVFLPSGRKTAYVRAAFSLLSDEAINEALKRLREVVLDARGTSE